MLKSDPNKIAEIVKDGISLGENSNPHTSTSGKVDESSKPDTSIPDFTLNINEDETKPDTSTPDTTFNTTLDEIFELIMKKNSSKKRYKLYPFSTIQIPNRKLHFEITRSHGETSRSDNQNQRISKWRIVGYPCIYLPRDSICLENS